MYLQKVAPTLLKSGGGFLPLQRFESAQTAFLVVVSLLECVSSLSRGKKHQFDYNRLTPTSSVELLF